METMIEGKNALLTIKKNEAQIIISLIYVIYKFTNKNKIVL